MSSLPAALAVTGLLVTTAALIWAAWSDVRRLMIPNRVSVAMAASYLLALPWMGFSAWVWGVVVAATIFAGCAFLFHRGWLGGGDVKMAGAATLWAGPALIADFVLMVALGGALTATLMLILSRPRPIATTHCDGTAAVSRLAQPMPFAVPLAAGGLWIVALQLASLV